jgi:hypothetical protein
MEPRPKFHLPDAIVAILAGEVEGGWRMNWRRKLFFLLIRLQTYWPLVPRISFKEATENTLRPVAPVPAEVRTL